MEGKFILGVEEMVVEVVVMKETEANNVFLGSRHCWWRGRRKSDGKRVDRKRRSRRRKWWWGKKRQGCSWRKRGSSSW